MIKCKEKVQNRKENVQNDKENVINRNANLQTVFCKENVINRNVNAHNVFYEIEINENVKGSYHGVIKRNQTQTKRIKS